MTGIVQHSPTIRRIAKQSFLLFGNCHDALSYFGLQVRFQGKQTRADAGEAFVSGAVVLGGVGAVCGPARSAVES
eukprot:GDKH01015611.1.p3 GENE.GDKH01015611.1~~GDKH01015611.1.p3  ORF type:complete len:75 (+),score=7.49 GDKH01015611.1:825-1049(+)